MMKTDANMYFCDISHQKIVIPGSYSLRMEEKSQKCKNNKNKTLRLSIIPELQNKVTVIDCANVGYFYQRYWLIS